MFFYFILFCIMGFVIGIIIRNIKLALGIIIVITLGWTFAYGPWALATFFELALGFAIARIIVKEVHQ